MGKTSRAKLFSWCVQMCVGWRVRKVFAAARRLPPSIRVSYYIFMCDVDVYPIKIVYVSSKHTAVETAEQRISFALLYMTGTRCVCVLYFVHHIISEEALAMDPRTRSDDPGMSCIRQRLLLARQGCESCRVGISSTVPEDPSLDPHPRGTYIYTCA